MKIQNKNKDAIIREYNDLKAKYDLLYSCVEKDAFVLNKTDNNAYENNLAFHILTENSFTGICIVQDNCLKYVNRAFVEMFGYTPDELIGKAPSTFVEAEDCSLVETNIKNRIEGKTKTIQYEFRAKCKNGDIKTIQVMGSSTIYRGRPASIANLIDITEQKRNEKLLADSEKKLQITLNNLQDAYFQVDVNKNIVFANQAAALMYGYQSPKQLIGIPAFSFFADVVQYEALIANLLYFENVTDFVVNLKNAENLTGWGSMNAQILKDSNGNIIGVEGVVRDITDRKKAEEAIKEAEIQFRSLAENSPDLIARYDKNLRHLYINPAAFKAGSLANREMYIGKTISEVIMDKTEAKQWKSYVKRVFDTAKSFETDDVFSSINGKKYLNTIFVPEMDIKGQVHSVLSISRDITEIKNAEIKALNTKEELRKFAFHLQHVREEEKVALARELHDDLGQILVSMKIDIGLLKMKLNAETALNKKDEINAKINNLILLNDKTIKLTRSIMNGLRPELLESQGLIDTTRNFLNDFRLRHNINCEFKCTENQISINPNESLALFRILQEALNNIVKHANASKVWVSLTVENNALYLEILDNGTGFNTKIKPRKDAYGMIGMRERVLLIAGKLEIESGLNKGTSIRVELPLLNT